MTSHRAFTLIELLIVVAIIAILAAIAVPNFLEAQTRSRVSRSLADMRTLVTATETYRVDWNDRPVANTTAGPGHWWGFTPTGLTTPIAYITSIPTMPFIDDTVAMMWGNLSGDSSGMNQPYTYIYRTYGLALSNPALLQPGAGGIAAGIPNTWSGDQNRDFFDKVSRSSYVFYTSGPDNLDGTVWLAPSTYDPTNGTVSFGDVHYFGQGDALSTQP